MTDTHTPALTEEEARKQFEDAQAALKKTIGKARKQFAYNLKLAQDRLEDATRELDRLQPRRVELAPMKDHPEVAVHYTNIELLTRIYSAAKRMMEIQVACQQHNLAVVEAESIPERPEFRNPETHLDYMEARAFSDLYLATFHWFQHGDGIDLLLRASGNGQAAQGPTEDGEFFRRTRADALSETARRDRNIAVLLGQLGTELKETRELIEWATGALARLATLNEEDKRAALDVPQWGKLNGKVALLGTLPDRVRHIPALEPLIRRYEAAPLPYEQVSWVAEDDGKNSTDRLTITGRLGQAKR
jgi:hypothetical protein